MTATAQMLFNMQKFQILSLFTSEVATRKVSPAYAYAWAEDLYPIGQHSGPWHEPYEGCFKIGQEQLNELSNFLDDLWTKGKTISFYDLETHYGVHGSAQDGPEWDRMSLVHACRYFHLLDWFDEEFWKGLVGHSDCPSESHSIVREYKASDVYFE